MSKETSTPMRLCADCSVEIRVLHAGDETLDFCENCERLEGPTIAVYTDDDESEESL